ncbi:transcription termination/antitermination protein NusG [Actinotignum sanguinis]|uniref:Transcription termination/antitermination protein NusG n=2 Tax=Actinomycetaceae TaxID=2049 RepID=A0ABZ0RA83_9ACTO|nr:MULTISPECIES: transcription termination/antitermination protein NusG [Actinotignum]WPJ88264.1 transcription termination/antitermination protein NusG [Schaalia turicensis]MDE1552393.1 transcription termination/antitermination protein NusG [Actinotignum sanguinis]MDE1565061.1 transcription termination/antitermination protein NusG [Actinotignum sanguinis]MDE1576472.1 transcription termination/antitermination protein NusG [Actinotignum sanguinis]MDE1641963.1 transcription termination/antitermin
MSENVTEHGDLFMEPGATVPAAEAAPSADSLTDTTTSEAVAAEETAGATLEEAPGAAAETDESSETEAPAPAADAAPRSSKKDKKKDGIVTEEEVRAKLKGLEGRWYVLHTYSGYEKRVKQDLEVRLVSMNMEDYIFQIEVPMEEVFEVRRGQRKLVSRVRMPGYVLIRMNLTDDSWRVVQSTNGVTGFVGNGRTPVALTFDEVVTMLTPVVEAAAADEARAAGLPTGAAPETIAPFEVGDPVTLTAEPWAGMPATVSEIDAENQRLTVMMTLVGQETPVELSFAQVRKED